jgi:hypothetical protein
LHCGDGGSKIDEESGKMHGDVCVELKREMNCILMMLRL